MSSGNIANLKAASHSEKQTRKKLIKLNLDKLEACIHTFIPLSANQITALSCANPDDQISNAAGQLEFLGVRVLQVLESCF